MANHDLTVGDPGQLIRSYCLPLFGSVLFQQLYNLADSFVAGRFLGEQALAAVGNSYEITLIFLAFAFGCNTGCSVLTARYFGAKEYGKVRTAISTSLIATAVICVILVLFGLFGSVPLLHLIQTPDSIFADSITYLRIYTCGLVFVLFYNVATGIFAALGDSRTPFWFLAISSSANIVLDILFVAVFHMGVAGVGWATFLCQGAACIPAMFLMLHRIHGLPCEKYVRISRSSLCDFISVAAPSILQQDVVATGNIIVQGVVNTYGAAVIAGYSAAVKMNNLVTSCFTTIGSGLTNYTAQNLGAKLPKRIRSGFKASVELVWLLSLVMFLLYEIFPTQLVRIFLNNPSAEALRAGTQFLRVASPFYFAPAFKIMCDAFLCGTKRMNLVVFSISLDLMLRAALAVVFSALFATAFSVWFAWPIGWVIAAIITYAIYRKVMYHIGG